MLKAFANFATDLQNLTAKKTFTELVLEIINEGSEFKAKLVEGEEPKDIKVDPRTVKDVPIVKGDVKDEVRKFKERQASQRAAAKKANENAVTA